MAKPLDIFDYSDYRIFLKKWIESARAQSTGNLSSLAQAANVHTTFLSHVLAGKKNLNLEQATVISETLSLTKIENEYFFTLIELDRAGTEKLRAYFREKKKEIEAARMKLNSRVGDHHELTDEERAIFYSSWIYVAMFVSCAIDDGQSLDQIAERFRLTRVKAEEYMSFLVKTGICEIKNGLYQMGKTVVYVPNDSPFVVKHHTNWRMRSIQKMDSREDTELFYSSPMSMSRKDFARVRELLAKVIQESLTIVKDSEAEDIVCLNIDLFRSVG